MMEKLPRLGHRQRKDKLEDNYGTHTHREIAIMCGVHESTIERDVSKWKASGEYDRWLDWKWHYYLEIDTVDDRTKFLALTRLKERRITQKIKQTMDVDVKISHDITSLLSEYENIFESETVEAQLIQENNT